jgi:hypothetical protein
VIIGLLAVFTILCFSGLYVLFRVNTDDSLWTIEIFNRISEVPIPPNASHIQVSGSRGRGGNLSLTFDAPAADALHFAEQFCDPPFYRRFDPFNAIEVAEPFTNTLDVSASGYEHIYAVDQIPESTIGTKCIDQHGSGGQVKVRIDTSNMQIYKVRVEKLYSCYDVCDSVSLNRIKPFDGVPIEFLGFTQIANSYQLTGDEACIGFSYWNDTPRTELEFLETLIGEQFAVRSGSTLLASGRVTDEGFIVNRLHIADDMLLGASFRRRRYYCFPVPSTAGIQQLRVTIDSSNYELEYRK